MMPLSPSTMTSRAEPASIDTNAPRDSGSIRACLMTHSAPALDLPNPRPAMSIQIVQSPMGASWLGRAHVSQS